MKKIAHLGGCRCQGCSPLTKALAESITSMMGIDKRHLGMASSAPSGQATKEKLGVKIKMNVWRQGHDRAS